MPEVDSCEIDGVECGIHELGKGAARSNCCADCQYCDWAPNDRKFVIEHDSYREHLCPTCAVNRGAKEEEFKENANDPRKCPSKPEFDENRCSKRHCKSVAGKTSHTLGNFTTSTLLKVVDNESREMVMICPSCWIYDAVIQTRKEKRFDYEDKPEDVLDEVAFICKRSHCKPSEKNNNTINSAVAGMKRPLPDSSEDGSVSDSSGDGSASD